MTDERLLIPELTVADPAAAEALLAAVFGFARRGEVLALGDQTLALRQGRAAGHGLIDHLALAVPDVDAALAAAVARGGVPDAAVTPDGPLEIAEFWDAGVRYAFLQGPEGARIELCARRRGPARGPGQDHVGLACADLPAMRGFLQGLGLTVLADVVLRRAEGATPVSFLAWGGAVVELYAPPALPPRQAAPGFWSGLVLTGTPAPGRVEGPEGLRLTLR